MTKKTLLRISMIALWPVLLTATPTPSSKRVLQGAWKITSLAHAFVYIRSYPGPITKALNAKIEFGDQILIDGRAPCPNPRIIHVTNDWKVFTIAQGDPKFSFEDNLQDITQKCPLSSGKSWSWKDAKDLEEYDIQCDGLALEIFPQRYFVLDDQTMFAVIGDDYGCLRKVK